MIAATIQYTRLRPATSANRPNTNAPRKVGASIVLFSRASLPGLSCHSLATSVDAIPHINQQLT